MFDEILADQDYDDVIEAIYLVARVIGHRKVAPIKELIDRGAVRDTSPLAQDLAKKVVHVIEEKEKVPMLKLNEVQCAFYMNTLSKIVADRAKTKLQTDKKIGAKLLRELRGFSLHKEANR